MRSRLTVAAFAATAALTLLGVVSCGGDTDWESIRRDAFAEVQASLSGLSPEPVSNEVTAQRCDDGGVPALYLRFDTQALQDVEATLRDDGWRTDDIPVQPLLIALEKDFSGKTGTVRVSEQFAGSPTFELVVAFPADRCFQS